MFYEYQTDSFILAVEQWLEQFRGGNPVDDNLLTQIDPDYLAYVHLSRQYESVLRAKTKPTKVLLSDFELETLQEFL